VLSDDEIMEDWQIPVMEAMADVVTESQGDVLEIGFGRGVASDMIQNRGVQSHTIVECNDAIVERYRDWRERRPDATIHLIHGKWQDTTDRFEQYDGIFFHTYPLNEEELLENVVNSVTFAANFFPVAADHLREGGAFSYLTNEADSLSRAHQRLLFEHFSSFSMKVVGPLDLPADSRDDLWADSMVVVKAIK
ncbi:MAG: class I SAM-dependent methyltransferase, partial [Rhodothermales bacterium]|nr:class I SAM-dependent methyltransferase [Rhodothermales bacterium]